MLTDWLTEWVTRSPIELLWTAKKRRENMNFSHSKFFKQWFQDSQQEPCKPSFLTIDNVQWTCPPSWLGLGPAPQCTSTWCARCPVHNLKYPVCCWYFLHFCLLGQWLWHAGQQVHCLGQPLLSFSYFREVVDFKYSRAGARIPTLRNHLMFVTPALPSWLRWTVPVREEGDEGQNCNQGPHKF